MLPWHIKQLWGISWHTRRALLQFSSQLWQGIQKQWQKRNFSGKKDTKHHHSFSSAMINDDEPTSSEFFITSVHQCPEIDIMHSYAVNDTSVNADTKQFWGGEAIDSTIPHTVKSLSSSFILSYFGFLEIWIISSLWCHSAQKPYTTIRWWLWLGTPLRSSWGKVLRILWGNTSLVLWTWHLQPSWQTTRPQWALLSLMHNNLQENWWK